MRTRWRWQWDGESLIIISTVWMVVWIVVLVVYQAGRTHHHGPPDWLIVTWLAPLELYIVGGTFWSIRALLVWLWHNPPIRRVREPVLDDLRNVRRSND